MHRVAGCRSVRFLDVRLGAAEIFPEGLPVVEDRLDAEGLPDAGDLLDEFVRELPPGEILAERRGAADRAVPVDLAGEGIVVLREADRLWVEVLRFPWEPFLPDSLPLVAAQVALRLAGEVRLRVQRRVARVLLVKSDVWDARSDELPRARVARRWPPPVALPLAPPEGGAVRRESDLWLAHLLVAQRELLWPERRELLPDALAPRRELRELPVSPELPLAQEPPRAWAPSSLSLRQSSPLRRLLPPPRDPENACEPFPRARYRSSSSASFSRPHQSSAKSRLGLWP